MCPIEAGPQSAGDARRRPSRRARRPLLLGRELPGRPARSRAGPPSARAHAAADPHGHRPLQPDARRAGRGRAGAAGDDPLRDPRGRDRDVDRAPRDPEPGDPGPADRRGAGRMGGPSGPRRPRAPGACRRADGRGHAGAARGDRGGGSALRPDRRSARGGRLIPVRRAALPRRHELPDRGRARALRAGQAADACRGQRRRVAAALNPPRQSSSTRWSRGRRTRSPVRLARR